MPNLIQLPSKVLVFDFDGLLCDGLDECLLVSWYGYSPEKDLSNFSDLGLQAIPKSFIRQFEHYRNFAKHLGHFAVSLFATEATIDTQADFEAVYNSLSPSLIQEFVTRVSQYRHQARQNKESDWLNYHQLYPGIQQFLSQLEWPFYIVSAKDEDSISKILNYYQIHLQSQQILGEQTQKTQALSWIAQRENIDHQMLYFFDDNIVNALEAKQAGYKAYWATWGYNVPEHTQIAQTHSLNAIALEDFIAHNWY